MFTTQQVKKKSCNQELTTKGQNLVLKAFLMKELKAKVKLKILQNNKLKNIKDMDQN